MSVRISIIYKEQKQTQQIFSIVLSFSIFALVGLTFGVSPAIKASKLDTLQSDYVIAQLKTQW